MENRGVEPDHLVDQGPARVAQGQDPQLDAAVALALDSLAKSPLFQPNRPPFLVHGAPTGQ